MALHLNMSYIYILLCNMLLTRDKSSTVVSLFAFILFYL